MATIAQKVRRHARLGDRQREHGVLAAKGHHYQFVFGKNVGYGDRPGKMQTLPEALESLWK